MADARSRIQALSPDRRALIDALAAGRRPDRAPTTAAQERYWRLNQADPADPRYLWPWALSLRGPLDTDALGRAVRSVLNRHDLLTSTFRRQDGELWQMRGTAPARGPRLVEVSDGPGGVQREIERVNRRGRELARQAPVDTTLLRLGPDEHVLVADIHAIANDAWSMRLFLDDLAAHYNGSPPASRPVPFAEHAARQRRWLAGEEAERQARHWDRALAGLPPAPRPAVPGGAADGPRCVVQRTDVPAGVMDGVRAIGRRAGATPFMTLYALFADVLGTLTGRTDIVVASSVSGRDTPDTHQVIGCFVNRVVLRVDVGGTPGDQELVRRGRASVLAALANARLPFEHVVRRVAPHEYHRPAPLTDVMFVYDDQDGWAATGAAPRFTGLETSFVEPEYRTTRFALLLTARPVPSGRLVLEAHCPSDPHHVRTAQELLRRCALRFARLRGA
ncbi:condensation domain-containing protein [Streptomyces cinerochromogenes]|uniref:Condensation domain-containing protein n=1 Tax=Streptomyces cinerochromogenes TaxID=66422 RepID=A0ABW7BAE5_9ACTN